MKCFSGDKYIYYLMAYKMAKDNKGSISIGNDSGYVGGQKYWRRFTIQEYQGQTILNETKSSPHFADYTRSVVIGKGDRPMIMEYVNESGENGYNWQH